MKHIIKIVSVLGLLSVLLVGCSGSNTTTETVEITNNEMKVEMKEVAAQTIKQYFDIDINDGVAREELAFENQVIDKEAGTKTHVSNMFRGTTMTEAREGEIQSYGVVMDKDNQGVQGAILQLFTTAQPQKYKEQQLKEIGDKFAITTGVVDEPSKWIYDGIEKAVSNKQLTVLRYKNEEIKTYLLVGISLQTGQVTYFERTVPAE
ncbi:MAG: hypothetical protein RR324_06705 [Cellulosilyticaceae bacterium]